MMTLPRLIAETKEATGQTEPVLRQSWTFTGHDKSCGEYSLERSFERMVHSIVHWRVMAHAFRCRRQHTCYTPCDRPKSHEIGVAEMADHHALRSSTEIAVDITTEQDSARMLGLARELSDALDREYNERHPGRKTIQPATKKLHRVACG